MPCTSLPAPTLPTLPGGITLAVPLPTFPGADLTVCCKIVSFPSVGVPLPLPPGTLNALAPLNVILEQVLSYINDLPISCPRE